jgi:WD40 repeat protein
MDEPNSVPSTLLDRLDADDPARVADALESPERATELCTEAGPMTYARGAERVADALRDDDASRSLRLELLAGAARLDAPFLQRHPERFVETVLNRCRWYAGHSGRFAPLDRLSDHAEPRTPEPVEGLDDLVETWREWHRTVFDRSRLVARRMPRDLPGEPFDVVARGREQFSRVTWGPEGRRLFAIESEAGLAAWDTETGERLWRHRPEHPPDDVEYNHPTASLVLVTRREEGEERQDWGVCLHRLDPETGTEQVRHTLEIAPQDQFSCVARDAPVALVGGFERAELIDLESGESVHPYGAQPHGGAISDDGQHAAFGRLDLRDTLSVDRTDQTTTPLDRPDAGFDASPTVHALHEDRVAIGDIEGGVRVWRADTGELVASFQGSGLVTDLAWSSEGDRLAASWLDPTEGTGHGTTVWDLEQEVVDTRLPTGVVRTNGLAFDPDDRRIAAADTDGRLRIHRLDRPESSETSNVPSDGICTSALDPNHPLVAVATHRVDAPIRLFDLETGELLDELPYNGIPDALDVSESGEYVMARSEEDPLDNTVWRREAADDWRRERALGVELLDVLDLEPEALVSQVYVDDAGATRFPNPMNPDEELVWPTPLLRMEGLDTLQIAEGCPWIVAHQCNRLEIVEVVET